MLLRALGRSPDGRTRSKSGIFKTKHSPDFVSLTSHALHAALFSLVQPKGFKSAAKHPQWMAAMHDEMEALKQNCTWTLVPRPSASNIVGSKWVYRIKYHADGSVERFKARVGGQGFTQNSRVSIIPTRSVSSCRDNSYLFSLKTLAFMIFGSCLLDDLILTGNNESLLTSFTTRLNQEFAIKDLGDLSYFLGLEVSYTNDGLFLSQAKYATDVLTRAALLDSKPVSTPC
ncbi:retrovirus-related pol polyprotein from transposon RE1 [Tanacetum coccineum]|uniref:Retrovirus-related pol polyprotein from transposon RE1 n=1 Tax=Tanacetum coccineum TaxID=301880 RepID=A0ABQ4YKW7_9ASTR